MIEITPQNTKRKKTQLNHERLSTHSWSAVHTTCHISYTKTLTSHTHLECHTNVENIHACLFYIRNKLYITARSLLSHNLPNNATVTAFYNSGFFLALWETLLGAKAWNQNVLSHKISIPQSPKEGFLVWAHPSGISSLAPYFPLKILAFDTPTPSEFPMTLHGVGMDILWNRTMLVIQWPTNLPS